MRRQRSNLRKIGMRGRILKLFQFLKDLENDAENIFSLSFIF